MVHPVVVADECLPENPAASYLFLVDERKLMGLRWRSPCREPWIGCPRPSAVTAAITKQSGGPIACLVCGNWPAADRLSMHAMIDRCPCATTWTCDGCVRAFGNNCVVGRKSRRTKPTTHCAFVESVVLRLRGERGHPRGRLALPNFGTARSSSEESRQRSCRG